MPRGMRRLARYLFHVGAVISLVLFVAVMVVWMASYRSMRIVWLTRVDQTDPPNLHYVDYVFCASRGVIRIGRDTVHLTPADPSASAEVEPDRAMLERALRTE